MSEGNPDQQVSLDMCIESLYQAVGCFLSRQEIVIIVDGGEASSSGYLLGRNWCLVASGNNTHSSK